MIEAARALFVSKGYADTATPEIVEAAGLTRGALYHHFEDKRALFEAVIAREAQAVAEAIEAGSPQFGTAYEKLISGAAAYFDAMAVPGRTRLLLLDGPAVLGLDELGAIDRENAEGTLREGLSDYLSESGKPLDLLDPLTVLVSAAFDRAAIAIAAGGDRIDYERAIAALIDGIGADQLRR
ncbi:TetR family transcriptional regulator [Rhizobium sp. BK251]|nr:TetR family transcriptional regulator [Rhizobium sp. BK251]